MSPVFKIGKVRIHRRHGDFIDQWISFDPAKRNQKDDLLDAVEIALDTAGALLPISPHASLLDEPPPSDPSDLASLVRDQIRDMVRPQGPMDPELGSEF